MFGCVLGPRQQGDAGELSAMTWLVEHAYHVYLPLGHSPDCDMIAARDGRLEGVQVKTSRVWRNRRWEVTLCTRGGNQSWNGVVKRFSSDRCDSLFVLVADGRRWFLPSSAVEGESKLALGGPKYAAYEVEPGRPFGPASPGRTLSLDGPRRDSGAVKRARL
jgi:hypothetical protein